jgi:hypothetical protein
MFSNMFVADAIDLALTTVNPARYNWLKDKTTYNRLNAQAPSNVQPKAPVKVEVPPVPAANPAPVVTPPAAFANEVERLRDIQRQFEEAEDEAATDDSEGDLVPLSLPIGPKESGYEWDLEETPKVVAVYTTNKTTIDDLLNRLSDADGDMIDEADWIERPSHLMSAAIQLNYKGYEMARRLRESGQQEWSFSLVIDPVYRGRN